ncbi:MAG TPA: ABC transporter permease [Candidatus Binataceae bacterium]|nr:ABC transporter permease [Candidatus Binataceae bacterium]
MKKSWAIMRRDLIKLSKAPALVISSVIMPMLFLLIFGNSLQGQLKHLPVVIVNEDQGPYALRVIEKMQALAAGPKTITLAHMDDPGQAVDLVRNGRYKAALLIPREFSRNITVGRLAELGLFTDNVDSISSVDLQGLVAQAVSVIRNGFVTAREPKLDQIVVRPSNLFGTVDYDRSLIPGVIVMALFMGSMTSGVFNWIMDRFSGVTEAYLVTPLSPWNIAGGILGSSILATTGEAILVLIGGLALTGGGLSGGIGAALMLCGVIVLTGTGLLAMMFAMYSRASNPRLIGGPAGFLNVILFFPSGAIYPIESLPPWLRAFTRWNPETHAISALKTVMFKGANFAAISNDLTFLTIFAAIMLVLAGATLRRSL